MSSDISILNTLHRCADIEGVLAEIYEIFASAYRQDPEVSQLFQKTAAEEKNHEYQIRLAIKNWSSMIREMNLSAEEAENHLSYAKQTLQRVREAVPEVDEALRMSIHCETIFSRFHLNVAAKFIEESQVKLFDAMMASDNEHIVALQKALEKCRH